MPDSGPYSYESRSLPYEENPNAYRQYEWQRSLDELPDAYAASDDVTKADIDRALDDYDLDINELVRVQRGNVAPAFDQPGGAVQDVLPLSVNQLEDLGMIKRL